MTFVHTFQSGAVKQAGYGNPPDSQPPADLAQQKAAHVESHAQELASVMMAHGESFWSAVYPQFMSRDMTRGAAAAMIAVADTRADKGAPLRGRAELALTARRGGRVPGLRSLQDRHADCFWRRWRACLGHVRWGAAG